ncbi:MLO-like protein 12 [Stylosanthes scabra]|uniref:MLO-like protein n=1 Tax=Stylosanthes scabra TaxID=79078 RepID=A0ABU6Z934_9FABA|nr:MLO-like protein 12 [Stylosanthes scabra]
MGGARSLEETPTWAVALVCFFLLLISILMDHIFHRIAHYFKKQRKKALCESLAKIKSELMLMGFISLLLTVLQGPISRICVPEKLAATWHPCTNHVDRYHNSFLLAAGSSTDQCAPHHQGKVALVSAQSIHQLHIFIFVLALFHVLYCILTLALATAKMKRWKRWEEETKTPQYQFSHDPERFRLTRQTSFGRRHLSVWTTNPVLIWIVCFFRQFVCSVPKVDYLTLRHGFVMAHLAPQSHQKFDFMQYIERTLEEDFKVVVEISPPIWFITVLFLLFHTHGWYSYLWMPFIPLIITVVVGSKLQVIITKMGLRIGERGDIVKGTPVVQPGDDLFWFNKPQLMLYLINFVLFQNAFQLAFFSWTALQFGMESCFQSKTEDVVIKISMGILVQILCSYVTLPLYALVTQMGSNMKPTIFNERVASALRNWHQSAKSNIKKKAGSSSFSQTTTPSPITSKSSRSYDADSLSSSNGAKAHSSFSTSSSFSASSHHRDIDVAQQIHEPHQHLPQHEIQIEASK